MILNATHEITLSGLPPDVLDAYVRYKKGTRAIVAWIVQYGPSTYYGAKRLPLKDLAILAEAVKHKLKKLPDVIHFHFRETIAARKRLSKYFRGNVDTSLDDMDTVNHEHFTSSLTQIYANLCACCGEPRSQCKTNNSERQFQSDRTGLENIFYNLDVEDSSDSDDTASSSCISTECSECTSSDSTSICETDLDMQLEDHDLENLLSLTTTVERASLVAEAIQYCWREAGKGNIQYTVASFITNVGLASLQELENLLRGHDEGLTVSNLFEKCSGILARRSTDEGYFSSCQRFLENLRTTEQSFWHEAEDTCTHCDNLVNPTLQKVGDFIDRSRNGDCAVDTSRITTALIKNINDLINADRVPGTIVRNSTPIYADMGYLLTHTDGQTDPFHCILGLDILSNSYQTFLTSTAQISAASRCRLSALRLAQQASSSIARILNDKASFPCRCTQTLAYHLQNLEIDLSTFAKQNCWTLFFQSPWVAGNHTLEILDLCHFYGTRLFKYRHYIGAVLHCYNVLQKLAGLEKIEVLEYLCRSFRDTFFPSGVRPTSRFGTSWARFTGARLKFKKGAKHRNQRDSWCMAIPAHAAKNAAGFGSASNTPDSRSDNFIFGIKQTDYHLSESMWDELRQRDRANESYQDAAHPLIKHLLPATINKFRLDSLGSPLLNVFAVFGSCVRVVSTISDATHKESSAQGGPADEITNCLCFASSILSAGDRIADARRLGHLETWRKHERECVDLVNRVLREQLGKITPEDWAWVL